MIFCYISDPNLTYNAIYTNHKQFHTTSPSTMSPTSKIRAFFGSAGMSHVITLLQSPSSISPAHAHHRPILATKYRTNQYQLRGDFTCALYLVTGSWYMSDLTKKASDPAASYGSQLTFFRITMSYFFLCTLVQLAYSQIVHRHVKERGSNHESNSPELDVKDGTLPFYTILKTPIIRSILDNEKQTHAEPCCFALPPPATEPELTTPRQARLHLLSKISTWLVNNHNMVLMHFLASPMNTVYLSLLLFNEELFDGSLGLRLSLVGSSVSISWNTFLCIMYLGRVADKEKNVKL